MSNAPRAATIHVFSRCLEPTTVNCDVELQSQKCPHLFFEDTEPRKLLVSVTSASPTVSRCRSNSVPRNQKTNRHIALICYC